MTDIQPQDPLPPTEVGVVNGDQNLGSPATVSRDSARALIFGAKPVIRSDLTLQGVPVDLREPSVGVVIDSQTDEDRKRAFAQMLIRYVYPRGGAEPLFEEADIDNLLELPFNKEMQDLNQAINKMIGVVPSTDDKSGAEA